MRLVHLLLGRCQQFLLPERPQVRVVRLDGQRNRLNVELAPAHDFRQAGLQRGILERSFLVAALEQIRDGLQVGIVDPVEPIFQRGGLLRQAQLLDLLRLAGQLIGAHVVRLEKRAQAIVLLLRQRIILVVVTAAALERHAQETHAGELDGVLEPDGAIEDVIVAAEVARRPQGIFIGRRDLVRSEHLDDHAVVALIPVERLDDPVAPAPDMPLAVTLLVDFAAAVPITVAPDVHPVPPPALAVERAAEEAIDHLVVRVAGRVGEKGVNLIACRRYADQVEVDAAQQHFLLRRRPRLETTSVMLGGNEGIDGIAHPAGVAHLWQRRANRHLIRPVFPRIFGDRFSRCSRTLVDPGLEKGDLPGAKRRALGLRRHPLCAVAGGYALDEQAVTALTRNDGRPMFASRAHELGRVEA